MPVSPTPKTLLFPPQDEVILPIRMAKYLGCHSAIITNAAGGLNPGFSAGDLMLIEVGAGCSGMEL
jgi:purine-nucleoside phosphorylase